MKPVQRWLWPIVKVVGSLVALILIVAAMSGWFHRKVDPGRAPQRMALGHVDVVEVELRTVDRITPAVGTIRAVHETAVASRLLARVKAVHIVAGQAVELGQVLVDLDKADLEARIREADANVQATSAMLAQAESDFDKIEQLDRKGAATVRELSDAKRSADVARANLQARQHSLEQARSQMEYATIQSPIAGVVIEKHVEQGDMAQPGRTLVTLYDPDRLQLVASVPERLAVKLKVGQSATVRVDAMDMTCQGKISEIVPQAAATSRAMLVKVTGPCKPGIYSGMFGRLLVVDGTRQQLLIPASAVRRVGQLEYVRVITPDKESGKNTAAQRFIRTGHPAGDKIEVLAGLKPGEKVDPVFGAVVESNTDGKGTPL